MLNVNVSAETEQILKSLAAQDGQSVADFAGKILEKELAENKSTSGIGQKAEDAPIKAEKRYMQMKGMFSGGNTDTSSRAKEILREEIGRNGFGDFGS